jgi:hypothetical protein
MTKMMHPYAKGDICHTCDMTGICDGFHSDYALLMGFDEAKAIEIGRKIYDPRYYMYEQLKVVEEKEYEWAIPPRYPS